MSGVIERVSRQKPCALCGSPDYDMRVHYPETGDVVHWCRKKHATKGELVTVGAQTYICTSSAKQIRIGVFNLFREYLSKEEWVKKQERDNPNWKPSKQGTRPSPVACNKTQVAHEVLNEVLNYDASEELAVGEEKPLPNEKLDKIYRAFLDMLVLEDKHRAVLLKEWNSSVHDVTCLLTDYPIRSLPPIDRARFANGEKFKNPTRKSIVSKLLSMFGDLRGVPGFYLRGGAYYETRPEAERWTFVGIEGTIFPCYDAIGYLYRLRIKDDYPKYEVQEGEHPPFNGQYGTFSHFYDKDGKHAFVFEANNGQKTAVDSHEVYGKVNGKYKAFSSVSKILAEDGITVVNTKEGGSNSGTPYSLYDKYSTGYTVVFGTEGEKKGMVTNCIKKFPVCEVAGVWTYTSLFEKGENGKSCIDILKEKGMKYFILCYDADKADNWQVSNAEKAFIADLKAEGVCPRVGYWKKQFDKGIDDILLQGVDVMIGPAL